MPASSGCSSSISYVSRLLSRGSSCVSGQGSPYSLVEIIWFSGVLKEVVARTPSLDNKGMLFRETRQALHEFL